MEKIICLRLRIVISVMMAATVLGLSAKEKCKVTIIASEGARPYELVIEKSGEDPRNAQLRTKLEDGVYECEIETDQIEKMSVVDFGEVIEKGSTSRAASFFSEDGATIRVYFDGENLTADSDGAEFLRTKRMEEDLDAYIESLIEGIDMDALTDEQEADLSAKIEQYKRDYIISHPMLSFLLDLSESMSNFSFIEKNTALNLDIYHKYYQNLYPDHNAHAVIARGENEHQILGKPYHDYQAYDADGQVVKASEYFGGRPTLVICWATWCAPCRREAIELIPIVEKCRERGLNAFSLAREFESPDKLKECIDKDHYPWPCLYDLDDRFGIFARHGAASSALFLLDANGTIVACGYDWADIAPAADTILKP